MRNGPVHTAGVIAVALLLGCGVAPVTSTAAVRSVGVGSLLGGACASRDGDVLCWGKWGSAFADAGASTSPAGGARPWRVAGLRRVRAVAAGADGACAITASLRLVCWGNPGTSELDSAEPLDLGLRDVRSVAMAGRVGCAVHGAGAVHCWGDNTTGQIGDAATGDEQPVKRVTGLPRADRVFIGAGMTCASARGTAWCWGANQGGVLKRRAAFVRRPVRLQRLRDVTAIAPLEGGLCVQLGQRLRCLGSAGLPTSRTPAPVAGIGRIRALAGGGSHACVIDARSRVACWGRRTSGQLGIASDQPPNPYLGVVPDEATPVVAVGARVDGVVRPAGFGLVRQLALGHGATCAITTIGAVRCVGAATIAAAGLPADTPWPRDPAFQAPVDVTSPLEVLG